MPRRVKRARSHGRKLTKELEFRKREIGSPMVKDHIAKAILFGLSRDNEMAARVMD